ASTSVRRLSPDRTERIMAIPEGYASVARGSGVARKLLDAAVAVGLPETVVRTTSVHGYLVPAAVAEEYEKSLKPGPKKGRPAAAKKTGASKKDARESVESGNGETQGQGKQKDAETSG